MCISAFSIGLGSITVVEMESSQVPSYACLLFTHDLVTSPVIGYSSVGGKVLQVYCVCDSWQKILKKMF